MNFGTITQTAVPHITTLRPTFRIAYSSYVYSLITQCSFLVLVIPLLGFFIYLSARTPADAGKSKKATFELQPNQQPPARKTTVLSTRTPKKTLKQEYHVSTSTTTNNYTQIQRLQSRVCYFSCFFVLHVMAVNRLVCTLWQIGLFWGAVLGYAALNLWRPCRKGVWLYGLLCLGAAGVMVGVGEFGSYQ